MERFWHLGPTNRPLLFPRQVFPRAQGRSSGARVIQRSMSASWLQASGH